MTFISKHEERDSELPKEREKLLDNIQNDLFEDDNILAFFYGGSIGNETTDLFSDIDLRVVVKPDKINEYVLNKKNHAENWGKVLYFEDLNPSSIYIVAHYDSFIKVDIFYYTPEYIQPSVWLKNIKILKDTDGMLTNILEQSLNHTYEPTLDEFEFWRTKFFAHLHEAYRRTLRKEYYYALDCIDKLRLSIVTAWYMESGMQPNSFGDWAKYEGNRSSLKDWQKSLLESWECKRDTVEIMNVMRSIVFEFKEVHRSLCNTVGVKEDPEWVNRIINSVL
ncbi:aminoglycoside 6-adenylyltransferase [Ruoffia sp. FAM 24228]|uniref:aminoglycoside 6-adenylyltransferase n=1 Tax=Ruoffia sp. FAM 24228 TaxID=3259517 RepID=UPI00388A56ED